MISKITICDDKIYFSDKNDEYHRINGPAREYANGSKVWFLHGNLHREDGPAVENADGSNQWWLDGKRHRIDGPALEYSNGYKEWWINDKKYKLERNYWKAVAQLKGKVI